MKPATRQSSPQGGYGDSIQDIIHAALKGDASLVKKLLSEGADINTVDPIGGFSCLHIVAMHGDRAVLNVLLEENSRTGELDFELQTSEPCRMAWQIAMTYHHYDIAELLDPLRDSNRQPMPPLRPIP